VLFALAILLFARSVRLATDEDGIAPDDAVPAGAAMGVPTLAGVVEGVLFVAVNAEDAASGVLLVNAGVPASDDEDREQQPKSIHWQAFGRIVALFDGVAVPTIHAGRRNGAPRCVRLSLGAVEACDALVPSIFRYRAASGL
jgi:hypothetical protein